MINENNFGRRQFLKTVGKSALLFAAGPVLSEFVSTKALASTTLSREILDLRSLLGSSAQLF
ncbi:MAG TPA: hypothetical protein VN132_06525, partial [Bdellovibrio sp.]|nr:hypothetical protein [Bdellovibrio sp.]